MLKITEDDTKKYKSAPCRMIAIIDNDKFMYALERSKRATNSSNTPNWIDNGSFTLIDVNILLINSNQIAIAHPFSMGIWDVADLINKPSFAVNLSLAEGVSLIAETEDLRKVINALLDSE